jgi:dephospho-CoA kinase
MRLLIGVMGEKGGGKGTFVNVLRSVASETISAVKSSDVLAETLNLWHIPLTRSNLQNMAIIMSNQYGKGTLSNAVRERINVTKEEIVIYEGIRWPTDIDLVRSFPDNLLVYITADPKVRFERMKKRNEKVGEGEMTFEQFMKEEQAGTETHLPVISKQADVKIENNGSKEEFKNQIRKLYQEKIKNM